LTGSLNDRNNKTDRELTKITSNDCMTLLTQDDINILKDGVFASFKDEISTVISGMSTTSTSNDAFKSGIHIQIKEHNKEMKQTMQAIKTMIMSM
jgi:hypothetical protein